MNKKCSLCKKLTGTVLYSKRISKDKLYCYYRCTNCNNKKMKEYYHSKKGGSIVKALLKTYYLNNYKKIYARRKLNNFIKGGHLKKPNKCSLCLTDVVRIQAHHADYNKPLDVVWVCGKCHWQVDHRMI